MTRASFSQKTMEWIVHLLKEASKTKGNSVKRWKNHNHYSEIFCSRNFNRFGRYFSIINMQGKKKTIIIVPEWSFNSRWLDIATKITNFINVKTTRTVKLLHRTTEEGLLYAEAVKNNKWSTREMNDAGVNRKGNSLFISEDASKTQNELLDRSVVGSLSEEISNVHLTEIRRWAYSSWKHHHGIYIYEMGRNQFLFEFPNKTCGEGRMVLEISQIPSRLVDAMLKLHQGKPEGSLDQTGRSSTPVLVPKDPSGDRKSVRWMDTNRRGNRAPKPPKMG